MDISKNSERDALSPEAKRALAEAKARREACAEAESNASGENEIGGPKGKDPVRYGDWERKGIAYDF